MAGNRNIEHLQWPFSYKNITDITQSESYSTRMLHVNNTNTQIRNIAHCLTPKSLGVNNKTFRQLQYRECANKYYVATWAP